MTQIEHHIYGNAILSTWRADLEYWTETTNTAVTIECWPGNDTEYYSAQTEGTNKAIATGWIGNMSTTITVTCTGQATKTKTVKNDFISDGDWTWTWTIARTHSAQTVTLGISDKLTNYLFIYDADRSETRTDTSSGTGTFTIPAKPSYTVSYNANGGSGAPGNQTKWYGETLTLSSTVPTRSGWTFVGWNTSSSATTATYQPGGSYTGNAALTLYAIWKKTITVTYNANGGSSAPATQSVTIYNSASSGNITLTTSKPSRTNFAFVSWNANSSGTGSTYNGGTSYSFSANTTLYAVWDAVPSISSLTAVRCDENGDPSDEGEYALITCAWFIDGELGDTATLTGTVTPQIGGSESSFAFSSDASGSGSKTAIALIGQGNGGALDTDMQYTVRVTAANGTRTTSRNAILTRAFFVMDWKAGGGAIGIGRAAPVSGLEIGYEATFDSTITSYGNVYLKDKNLYLDNQMLDTAYNATLSAQAENSVFVYDKNSAALAAFRGRQLTTGEKRAIMEAHGYNSNGESIWCNFVCQVDKNGTRSYSVSDQGAFRNAISAVSRGGDTLTGNLLLKDATIDRDGSNPSSTLWARNFQLLDKDGERIAAYTASRETDGRTRAGIWAYNEKTDGTEVSNAISIFCARDGTLTYGIGNATNFRNALGASSGAWPVSIGGTGATTAANARTNLGASSGTWPISVGGTGATTAAAARTNLGAAAKTWTSIASTSGTTAKTFSTISSYSEVLIIASYSTSYVASGVFNIASIASSEKEFYLTGGRTYGGGRRACCKLSLTKITPYQVAIDDSGANANWSVHVR